MQKVIPASKCISILLLIICTALSPHSFAQLKQGNDIDKKENDIDIDYEKCVAKDTACPNVSDCAYRAYDKWHHEMEDAYKALLHELKKEEEKEALKQSQDAWIAYRDYTFKSYDMMFDLPGDKWCRLRHDDRIGIVRARALQLKNYFEVLKKKGFLEIFEKK